jgi:hypothetical protein
VGEKRIGIFEEAFTTKTKMLMSIVVKTFFLLKWAVTFATITSREV